MYQIIQQKIHPKDRAEINSSILRAIESGKNLPSPEIIFNSYTGKGGLHGLRRSDFEDYHKYAQAKKEFEIGQFFTPPDLCRRMVEIIAPVGKHGQTDPSKTV